MQQEKKTLSADGAPHLYDILNEKLEQAFHKPTATVAHRDIARIACEHSPVDLALAARRIPMGDRSILYDNLFDIPAKIEFMVNTDNSTRASIFWHMSDADAKTLVEQMPPDEAVEVLEDLSERRFRKVMEMLDPAKARRIKEIRQHHRNTAGRLMTNEFFSFAMDTTIKEAASYIRDHPGIELTAELFILSDGVLAGVVPARNLIINPPSLPLRQVMRPILHKVRVETPREEVIELAERYKSSILAVVDEEDHLVGVIPFENVMEALGDMADEMIANMAGTAEKVSENEPLSKRFWARAPWLVVTLAAGLLNVGVMSSFRSYEGELFTFVLFFVPLITGMSGNIGIQSSTILVRNMATGVLTPATKRETIFRELAVGLTIAIVFGIICGCAVYLLDFVGTSTFVIRPSAVGLLVASGLFGACLTGSLLGVFSPFLFARLGIDPAVASGPIVTAFNDFLSMSIYLLIAIGIGTLLFG